MLEFRDLIEVELRNNNLKQFMLDWESITTRINELPTDKVLEDLFLRQLEKADQLKGMLDLHRLGITQKCEPKDFHRLLAWLKHTWKRGDRKRIVTNTAKSEREGLDPHRQLQLDLGAFLQERRAYARNTAGLEPAVETATVVTCTHMNQEEHPTMRWEATPRKDRVHKPREARRKKAKEKAEVKNRSPSKTVTEVNSALTVLPVPTSQSYFWGTPLVVCAIAPRVGSTSAEKCQAGQSCNY